VTVRERGNSYTNHVVKTPVPRDGLSNAQSAVLRVLRELGGARTVKELSAELGQHVNTVREHLDVLVSQGLVLTSTAKPSGRGRPAATYRVNPARGAGERLYVDLANELARMIEGMDGDSEKLAVAAGRSWGRRMIDADPEGAGEGIRPWLAMNGWHPLDGPESEIIMQRCPIVECARSHAPLVCAMHLGVMLEYATYTGIAQDVTLTPDFDQRFCRLELGARGPREMSARS
jgi:predicted ArsR family transcriptional regulator